MFGNGAHTPGIPLASGINIQRLINTEPVEDTDLRRSSTEEHIFDGSLIDSHELEAPGGVHTINLRH